MRLSARCVAFAFAFVAAACESSDDDKTARGRAVPPGSGVHEAGGGDPKSDPRDGGAEGGSDGGPITGVSVLAIGSGAGLGSDGDHTCVVAGADRSVFCWGANDRGQVGNGKSGAGTKAEDVTTPVKLATDETGQPFVGITELSLAGWHSCARRLDAIHCWGQRFSGAQAEPPNAANPDRTKPRSIGGLSVTRIAAGGPHTCALRTTGRATCFGHSTFNELGRPNPDDPTCTAPFFVDYAGNAQHSCSGEALDATGTLNGATALTAGEAHSCAIVAGRVLCWGTNTGGRLGEPTSGASELNAQQVVTDPGLLTPLDNVTEVASNGASHTCALRAGKVYCWGTNASGQLGVDPTSTAQRPYATAVAGVDGATAIDAAEGMTCAVVAGGVTCWGNLFGSGGARVPTFTPTPVKGPAGLASLDGVSRVAVGKNHVCALRTDATVWCWGANERGQLGDGTTTMSEFPIKAKGLPE